MDAIIYVFRRVDGRIFEVFAADGGYRVIYDGKPLMRGGVEARYGSMASYHYAIMWAMLSERSEK